MPQLFKSHIIKFELINYLNNLTPNLTQILLNLSHIYVELNSNIIKFKSHLCRIREHVLLIHISIAEWTIFNVGQVC